MSRNAIIDRPIRLKELAFDDLYEEISRNWRTKSETLQSRRWRFVNQSELYKKQLRLKPTK